MSSEDTEDFSKIVEEYRKKYPTWLRTPLGKLIRAEKHIKRDSGGYRKLNRHLEKSFDEDVRGNY